MKDIPGYEGLYAITEDGQVWGHKRKHFLTQSHMDHYPHVVLCKNGKTKTFLVHRLVAQTFIPNPDGKPCVNHIDFNPKNNSVQNLEWVTQRENVLWSWEAGRCQEAAKQNSTKGNRVIMEKGLWKPWQQAGVASTKKSGNAYFRGCLIGHFTSKVEAGRYMVDHYLFWKQLARPTDLFCNDRYIDYTFVEDKEVDKHRPG